MTKTTAVLIEAGRVVAQTQTSAKSGEIVYYGWQQSGRALVMVGTAKISRARRYLDNRELMLGLEDRLALVNRGGGDLI
jgi:hypothetical protein